MTDRDIEVRRGDRLTATWVELIVRLGVLALLLYVSFVLVQPFIAIALWSVVLTVALYPVYDWMVRWLGGRRRLAALLLTALNFLIVIGPAAWLVLGLIESLQVLSGRFDLAALALPPPPLSVQGWPLIGEPVYQFWSLASTNLQEAVTKVVPYLKPVGSTLLDAAAEAGTGILKLFAAILVAGFLFPPGPALRDNVIRFSRRLASGRGENFVQLAGATIRAVSRGVIGISALQAFLAGVGLVAAGIPAASLITSAVLILGIIQIGPSIIIIPLVIWSWFSMEPVTAVLFTVYMIPVNLLDNILRPLVMGRGLDTPILIILIGVIGGTLSYGITGLFLGPIVLAVIWELLSAWIRDVDTASDAPL
jgi:predicted PurR-regulated permease PerM